MNQNNSRIPTSEKKAEGIQRMKDMGFNRQIVRRFLNKNRVTVLSDYGDKDGQFAYDTLLYQQKTKFERDSHSLVYAIIRSHTDFGLIDHFLYVSDYREDWEIERNNAKDLIPLVYAINQDHPEFSEHGSISIRVDEFGFPTRFFNC